MKATSNKPAESFHSYPIEQEKRANEKIECKYRTSIRKANRQMGSRELTNENEPASKENWDVCIQPDPIYYGECKDPILLVSFHPRPHDNNSSILAYILIHA